MRKTGNTGVKTAPFPKVVKFVCDIPSDMRERIFLAPASDGLFFYALFPSAVTLSPENRSLLDIALAVANVVDEYGK